MSFGDDIRQDRKVRAFHEAGHAIVNVYIGLPFASVSLLGVDFGTVDDARCDAEQLIKLAKSTTAGVLATHRYDRLHPDAPLVHTDREGEQDEQTLKEIADHLRLNPSDAAIRDWKDEVQTLLETPLDRQYHVHHSRSEHRAA